MAYVEPPSGAHRGRWTLGAPRTRAKITKATLAKLTGLPLETVAQLEDGELEPTWTAVQLIAKALGRSSISFADPSLKLPGEKKFKSRWPRSQ
jgi:DNA-binding XRE family transcriptional regulator